MKLRSVALLLTVAATLPVQAAWAATKGSSVLVDGEDDENPLAKTPPRHQLEQEEPAAPSRDSGQKTRFGIWKWTAAGTSAALLGTGLVFMMRAGSQEDELEKQTGGTYHRGVHDLENGWKQNRAIGYGALVAGGLTAAATFVLFVKDRPVEPRTAVAPLIGPSFAGAAAHVRF